YVGAEGLQLPALTSVGGSLDVGAEGLQLPALTSVGGSLYVRAEGLQLPALTSVGGSLDVGAEGLQLPALTSVGGYPCSMAPINLELAPYWVTITDTHMNIGCQWHSLAEWEAFDDRRIAEMDGRNAVRWWAENKATLMTMARAAGRVFAMVQRTTEEVAQ
ncbi:MAG: hypothetical protein ACTHK2_04680, partial [Dokdonella sp.]|uniref:hypothetical protein n=1 Tax=Dokdonella sp. TaxID=2291710 RepID=UPI003F80C172